MNLIWLITDDFSNKLLKVVVEVGWVYEGKKRGSASTIRTD